MGKCIYVNFYLTIKKLQKSIDNSVSMIIAVVLNDRLIFPLRRFYFTIQPI